MRIVFNERSIEPVMIGDKYKWTKTVSCRSGAIQKKNSIITVIASTNTSTWGEISESGFNWICLDGNETVSEWSTLEACISRGVLVKI